jgi:hypothetical protein
VLHSAVSNAEANHNLIGDELYVSEAYADEGPTIKRWKARARGRVNRIFKRTCHITVKVAPALEPPRRAEPATEEKPKRTRRAPAAKKSTTRKKTGASS